MIFGGCHFPLLSFSFPFSLFCFGLAVDIYFNAGIVMIHEYTPICFRLLFFSPILRTCAPPKKKKGQLSPSLTMLMASTLFCFACLYTCANGRHTISSRSISHHLSPTLIFLCDRMQCSLREGNNICTQYTSKMLHNIGLNSLNLMNRRYLISILKKERHFVNLL